MRKFILLIRLIFFIWTVILSLVILRGAFIFPDPKLVLKFLFPGFWVLLGMVLGSIIGELIVLKKDLDPSSNQASSILLHSYLIGWIVWLAMGLIYIFAG